MKKNIPYFQKNTIKRNKINVKDKIEGKRGENSKETGKIMKYWWEKDEIMRGFRIENNKVSWNYDRNCMSIYAFLKSNDKLFAIWSSKTQSTQ